MEIISDSGTIAPAELVVRPFRFGINVRTAGSAAEWADKARKVERLGYSVLLVPDHLAELLAPFPALAAAAAATTRLRVGTGVLNNDLRHPLLTAREAATLDVLSDGRLELGIGGGRRARAPAARDRRRALRAARAQRAGAAGDRDGRSPQGRAGADRALAAPDRRRDTRQSLCAARHGGPARR